MSKIQWKNNADWTLEILRDIKLLLKILLGFLAINSIGYWVLRYYE